MYTTTSSVFRSSLLEMLIFCVQQEKYRELGDDRNLATVTVLSPETVTGDVEVWRLLWTIKRHRDPNGRKSSLSVVESL